MLSSPRRIKLPWCTFTSGRFLPRQYSLTVSARPEISHGILTNIAFSDNAVTISVNTHYPFGDKLTTTITATSAFTYYVRIPSWVTSGTISIDGGAATSVSRNANGLQAVSIHSGTTSFVLNLPAPITLGTLHSYQSMIGI